MTTQRFRPATREEWLRLHDRDVTASRIGALVDTEFPYGSAYQLWAEKTGRIKPDHDDSPAKRRGRLLEAVAADIAAEELAPAEVTRNELDYWRDETLRIGATPDTIVNDPTRGKGVVELKNVERGIYERKWINGEPPLWIACQAITQANMIGAEWCAVGVLRVSYAVEFDLIPIPMHAGAWQAMQDAVGEFWRSVETDTPPEPDYKRDHAIIKALHPHSQPNVLDLSHDTELIANLHKRKEAKELMAALGTTVDEIDAEIRHKAGDAEAFTCGDYRVSLKTQHISGYTVAPRTQRPIRIRKDKIS
jgi:hypothetical protein